jgi:ATP-dependent DNA helicase RecG
MELNTGIQYLKGVGEKRAKLLGKLGISNVGDLLRLFPRQYEDWSTIVSIADAPLGVFCCVKAIPDRKPVGHLVRKGMTIFKTDVTDGESSCRLRYSTTIRRRKTQAGEEFLFFGKYRESVYERDGVPGHRKTRGSPAHSPGLSANRSA